MHKALKRGIVIVVGLIVGLLLAPFVVDFAPTPEPEPVYGGGGVKLLRRTASGLLARSRSYDGEDFDVADWTAGGSAGRADSGDGISFYPTVLSQHGLVRYDLVATRTKVLLFARVVKASNNTRLGIFIHGNNLDHATVDAVELSAPFGFSATAVVREFTGGSAATLDSLASQNYSGNVSMALFGDGNTIAGWDSHTGRNWAGPATNHAAGGRVGFYANNGSGTGASYGGGAISIFASTDRYITIGGLASGDVAEVRNKDGSVLATATSVGASVTVDVLRVHPDLMAFVVVVRSGVDIAKFTSNQTDDGFPADPIVGGDTFTIDADDVIADAIQTRVSAAAVRYGGNSYIGSVGAYGDVKVSSLDHGTGVLLVSPVLARKQADDHNDPSVLVDSSGYVWAFYSKHASESKLYYRKSTSPEDVSAWDAEVELAYPGVVTYPQAWQTASGRIVVNARQGAPPTGWAHRYTDNDGSDWSAARTWISGSWIYLQSRQHANRDVVSLFQFFNADEQSADYTARVFRVNLDTGEITNPGSVTVLANFYSGATLSNTAGLLVYNPASGYRVSEGDVNEWGDVAFATWDAASPAATGEYRYVRISDAGVVGSVQPVVATGDMYAGSGQWRPAGVAVSQDGVGVVYTAREDSGTWIIEAHKTLNEGVSWAVTQLDSDSESDTPKRIRPTTILFDTGTPTLIFTRALLFQTAQIFVSDLAVVAGVAAIAPPPGTPVITATLTGPRQITITTTTPGSGAADHELYVQEDTATGLYDAGNVAVIELGVAPDPIVIDDVPLGETLFFGLLATNEYGGNTQSVAVSVTVPEAALDVTAITYQSAILQLLGAGFAVEVWYQTTLAADTEYATPIDDIALTDASRFYRTLSGLDPATSLRSQVFWREEIGGAWLGPLEQEWATVAAPADTSKIIDPTNGEPIRGFFCITVQLSAGRSIASIAIIPQGGSPIALPALCFDTTAFDDGWYELLITTDLATELTSTFRIDNSDRIGGVACATAVAGTRAGNTNHIWQTSNLLASLGLGCTVLGHPTVNCTKVQPTTRAYLLFPTGPAGADLLKAASQRISAFMTLDPNCTGPIAFYPKYGQEISDQGVGTHISAKPGGGYWGVRAFVHTGLFTPYTLPSEQRLTVEISAPGVTGGLAVVNIDFPAPVLVPWWNYAYAPAYGSGLTVELDVSRIDPSGSTYRIRAWAAGVLMYNELWTFSSALPPGLPGLVQSSFGGGVHWAGIQLYDVCSPDVIHVTEIRRLEVWDDVAGAGGEVLAYVPEVISAEDERELMGEERLRVLLVHGSPGTAEILGKRVLRTIYMDFTWEEWRIEILEDGRAEDGSLALKVEAVGIIFDLAHGRVQQVQANGNIDTDFDPPAMSLEDHIAGLILPSPDIAPHFGLGELAHELPVEISYAGDVPLSAVRALAAAGETEYHALRGCEKYLITMPDEIGSGAPIVRIRYAKQLRELTRQLDFTRLATRVYPRGGEQDGFALTIAGALWEVTDVDDYTQRITLAGDPFVFADQVNGLMARKYGTSADVVVIATDETTQQVELSTVSNLEVGDYIQFRDPIGRELLYMDWPAKVSQWGMWSPPDAVEASDVPPVDNLLRKPYLDAWPGGVLTGWSAVGGATLEQVTDRLFHRYGIAAARLVAASDGGGIESDWHIVAPVGPVLNEAGQVIGEGSPYFTIQVALWIARGAVRMELDVDTVGDGSNIVTLPDAGEAATSNELNIWIDSLAMNADLFELGAKRVRVRLVQDGADATTFILDAAQLTQTHGGAVTFYDRRASNELWRRGALHLAEFGDPLAVYDAMPLDLYRLDPEAFVGEELVLGGTVLVDDLDMGATVRARIITIGPRVLAGRIGQTMIRVSNRNPALSRLLQAERDRRRRRLGDGGGGGVAPAPPTPPPPAPPPVGFTPGGVLSNLIVTLVQDGAGDYYHQLSWSHNQTVEDDVASRFTIDILSDEGAGGDFAEFATARNPKLEYDDTNAVPLVGSYRTIVYPVPKDDDYYVTYFYRVELYDATSAVPTKAVQRLETSISGYYTLF